MEEKEVKQEELFIPKTKHKGLKILIGIILIVGLGVGGYFLYQYKFNNPKTIITNVLDKAKSNLKESLVTNVADKKYKVDGHIKVDTNITDEGSGIIDLLKNIELQFSGEIDPTNTIGNFNINTKYKNDKLIDMKAYYENSVMYLFLTDLYDKYLKIDTAEDQENNMASIIPEMDINPNDAQAIMNSILDAMKKEINKLEINKENATITIDGKEVSVVNNYIMLRNDEVTSFIRAIMNDLKDDKNFVDAMKKITGDDMVEAINSLNNEVMSGFQGTYELNFYTDKSLFNKDIVKIKQNITMSGITMSFNFDKISDDEFEVGISMIGASYKFRIKRNNSVFNIKFTQESNGIYLSAEVNMNYEEIKEVTKPDVSNNKDINSLTEKESKQIEENLLKNKTLANLIEQLSKTTTIENEA